MKLKSQGRKPRREEKGWEWQSRGKSECVLECPGKFVLSHRTWDMDDVQGKKQDFPWRIVDSSESLLSSGLLIFLFYPVRDQLAFPTTVQLISAGDSHTQNTQASYFLSHFSCVLGGHFNHPWRMLSHVTSVNVSKLLSLFSSPLTCWACTLVTRWFCNLLSCPQLLSVSSNLPGAITHTPSSS